MHYLLDQMIDIDVLTGKLYKRYLDPEQVEAFLDNPKQEKEQLERES